MTEFTKNRLTYQPAEQYDGENWAIATVQFGLLGGPAFVVTTDHVQPSDMQLGHPEADVRLWCAARDLYAACQLALNAFERRDAIDWGILEAALAKARGV